MLFNSFEFLLFFPIVVFIYFLLPRKVKNIWLLVGSYFFYMCWDPRYIFLLLFSTTITYFSGVLIEKHHKNPAEKVVLTMGILLELSMLAWFKYINLFLGTLSDIFSFIGGAKCFSPINLLLPVGISFFTFQAMGYIIDVYRGDVEAEKNFLRYALFLSFFPQLVAGPIERSGNLLKQLREEHFFDYERAKSGLLLMLWGLFMKMVIADRAAIIVDSVYGSYSVYGGWYLVVATMLFGIQLYCDFAGYSTVAVGAAEVLGFRLTDNFQSPFFSKSVSEFWRCWHVSLTRWFRDYLYIPMGGNRKGRLCKYRNLLTVGLVSGLWHGADWSYVVWGGANSLLQIAGDVLKPVRAKICRILRVREKTVGHSALRMILTISMFLFTLVFFRADNIGSALDILQSMLSVHNPWILFDGSLYSLGVSSKGYTVLILAIVILFLADYAKKRGICIRKVLFEQDVWIRWGFYLLAIMSVVIFGIYGNEIRPFVYFAF